jgi:hypothetical protein
MSLAGEFSGLLVGNLRCVSCDFPLRDDDLSDHHQLCSDCQDDSGMFDNPDLDDSYWDDDDDDWGDDWADDAAEEREGGRDYLE